MRYRLAPAARFDIDQIWSYIAEGSGSPHLADHFIDVVYEHIGLLAIYPHLGRDRSADLGHGYRSFVIEEYLIIYRVEPGESVLVLRVVHGRRDLEALFG